MQDRPFRKGERVEHRVDDRMRRGVVASVGWSGCLGDVVVVHFDDHPTGLAPDVVVSGDALRQLAPSGG